MGKSAVAESAQTRKTREKLQKKLEALEKKITKQALDKKVIEIHRWIAKNSPQRVVLPAKNISLFDENQNAAKVSRKIIGIAEQIRLEMDLAYSKKPKVLKEEEVH